MYAERARIVALRCALGAALVGFCLAASACSILDGTSEASPPPTAPTAVPTTIAQPPSATAPPAPSPLPTAVPAPSATPVAQPADSEALLVAVGDIMVHSPQLPGYYNAKTKKYDFRPWFKQVKPLLRQGDWVVGNLETPIAGADLKYTGYPRFNAPTELADALKDAGFQVLSTANNHTLDRGYPGLARTLGNLRKRGLVPVGTAVDETDAARIVIEERNGIKLGFLSYTYGTNGIPLPEDKPFAVNFIDREAIASDIRRTKEAGADAVAVSLHFGIEYQRTPNDAQRRIAREAIEAGADLVLGAHPHVVQPYETIEADDPAAPGGKRRGLVLYSMGNFISNQSGNWKNVGVIMQVKLSKHTENGVSSTTWSDVTATPTWVHIWGPDAKRHYTVIPMQQALVDRHDPNLTSQDYAAMAELLPGINRLLGQGH
ncbi:CapA family protein [Cohnella sp. REN36]|uniref:CapA family protein n=1 Tax=Cohnella sp. REN36 TaxID=2887347 RepID=UPI001D154038|nr:CapA family protein [Cohnella sp. REN36]MCC3373291.1 CapA family protein [Cohnella sp. REN36]